MHVATAMNMKHSHHGVYNLCILCFLCIAKAQTESPGHSWASLLDRLCRTLHLQRMVFLSRHIQGGTGGFQLARTSITDGSRTVRFVGQEYQGDLDLLESRESLVVDTADMDPDKLFQLLSDNMDAVGILSPAILVLNSKADIGQLKFPDFRIDQMVYFLVLEEGVIFEKYSINEQTIIRDLYEYNNKSELFEPVQGVSTDFVLRRSNLQGVHLKVFVGHQPPYLSIGDRPRNREYEKHTTVEGVQAERVYPEQMEGIFRNLQVIINRL